MLHYSHTPFCNSMLLNGIMCKKQIDKGQVMKQVMKNREKHLHARVQECSQALQASATLCNIIFEKYLADILSETRQIAMKELNEITIYNYIKLRKYLGNNIYRPKRKTIKIIADNQLLSEKSKSHSKYLISKLVLPSKFYNDSFENRVGRYITDKNYTAEEIEFIELMLNELLSIAGIKEFARQISARDLSDFNSLNDNSFYHSAKKVYNDILQRKLHAGDNIMKYLKTDLSDQEIAERLEKSCKFDYFFDKDGILKCDLEKNCNILIKNFLNTVLYSFKDQSSRITLLLKLNCKYPILIRE